MGVTRRGENLLGQYLSFLPTRAAAVLTEKWGGLCVESKLLMAVTYMQLDDSVFLQRRRAGLRAREGSWCCHLTSVLSALLHQQSSDRGGFHPKPS